MTCQNWYYQISFIVVNLSVTITGLRRRTRQDEQGFSSFVKIMQYSIFSKKSSYYFQLALNPLFWVPVFYITILKNINILHSIHILLKCGPYFICSSSQCIKSIKIAQKTIQSLKYKSITALAHNLNQCQHYGR